MLDNDADRESHNPSSQPFSNATASRNDSSRKHDHLAAFEGHRSLLLSIAYRMLGSRVEAEDMVQETFLRWQQASTAEIREPRAFLVTVITRLCINELQSARVKREQYFGQWLPEPLLTRAADPIKMPGLDGSLSMAFLLLLERLTPTERAVFLLREVFDYGYAEIAAMLGHREANCLQILARAKQHVTEDRPRFEASPERREKLLQQFLQTAAQGDMQGLIALLRRRRRALYGWWRQSHRSA